MIIRNGLFTTKYTCVECENKEEQKYNAPHHFKVKKIDPVTLSPSDTIVEVNFQEGPIKECGINGVNNEDLILMVIERLKSFQETPYSCRENAMALTNLEQATMWLRKRTQDREARQVEGTSAL